MPEIVINQNQTTRKPEQKRTKEAKERFAKAFQQNRGEISATAARAGVHRSTYYDWVRKDPGFKMVCREMPLLNLNSEEIRQNPTKSDTLEDISSN